jgi:hypothetical protein
MFLVSLFTMEVAKESAGSSREQLLRCRYLCDGYISLVSDDRQSISYLGPAGAQNSPVLLISNPSMKDASVFAA